MVLEEIRAAGVTRSGKARAPAAKQTQLAAFLKRGDFWVVRFEGTESHIKDSRGMGYLAALLRAPRKEIHVLELTSPGFEATKPRAAKSEGLSLGSDVDPVLDSQAIAAYRQRILDIQEEIDQAES